MCALKLVDITSNLQGQTNEIKSNVSGLIPKNGNRGVLAGYESFSFVGADITGDNNVPIVIDESSPDVVSAFGADITVQNGDAYGLFDWYIQLVMDSASEYPLGSCTSWTKIVWIFSNCTVTLSSLWKWKDNVAPEIGNGLLLLHWNTDFGTAAFIDTAMAAQEILESKLAELQGES